MRKNAVNKQLESIEGGVCAPEGFKANAVACGIRTDGGLDFGMLFSDKRCAVACAYADTPFLGAPVKVSNRNMKYGYARAILVNGGVANCISSDGEHLAESVCDLFGRYGVERTETIIASTGRMGEKLTFAPFEKGAKALWEGLASSPETSLRLAQSITANEGCPKELSFQFMLGDYPCKIGAVFTGSHNNATTFLAFLTTDVNVSSEMLSRALSSAVRETVALINVGVSSPNDTVCILSSGKAGNYKITCPDGEYKKFADLLKNVLVEICKTAIRDAQGEKNLYVRVGGAKSKKVSRALAKKIAGLCAVKREMVAGTMDVDVLLCALLCEEELLDPSRIQISVESVFGALVLFEEGKRIPFFKERICAVLRCDEITIRVDLGEGNFESTAYGRV